MSTNRTTAHFAILLVLFGATITRAHSAEDPIFHLPLDEDVADVTDPPTPTAGLGSLQPVAGFLDGAMEFDGRSSAIVTEPTDILQGDEPFTISLFVKLAAFPDPNCVPDTRGCRFESKLILKDHEPGLLPRIMELFVERSEGLRFLVNPSTRGWDVDIRPANRLSLGVWHHVVATFDPVLGGELFVDGTSWGKDVDVDPAVAVTGTTPIDIGNATGIRHPRELGLEGAMDDVKIFDRVLTLEEIRRLPVADEDDDGVPDDADACSGTEAGAVTDARGCSIAQICPCDDFRSHGRFQSCVARTVEDFVQGGLLSEAEGEATTSASARSDCGKPARSNGNAGGKRRG